MSDVIGTGTDHLLSRRRDGILTLTLNRPKARNAISVEMLIALDAALARAETDPNVRCVVLTGAGKGFCAGGDVKGMAATGDSTFGADTIDGSIDFQRRNQRGTAGRLYMMPKPTLAVLPGAAAGAGLSLALACDLRIMARDAVMTTAFAKIGFCGDYGGTFFMQQLVGTAKTRELYFLSSRVSAEEALALGLTNWVCEPEGLQALTEEVAMQLACGPPIAFRYMKENICRAASSPDALGCMDLEATYNLHCGQTEDHREAVKAFMEKRKPTFCGR